MISYACEADRMVFQVPKLDPQVRLLTVVLNCPTCHRPLTITSKWGIHYEKVLLTAEQLFKASNGLALPGAESASEARVSMLLIEAKFVSARLEAVAEDRVIIESLTIETANVPKKYTFHFGTSTKGATIYKITEQ